MTSPNNYSQNDVAKEAVRELRIEAGYYPPNPWLKATQKAKESEPMKKLTDRLIAALIAALLPRLLEQLIMAVEEMVKLDLNKDGHIGFGETKNG